MCVTVKIERDIVGSERDREEKETCIMVEKEIEKGWGLVERGVT